MKQTRHIYVSLTPAVLRGLWHIYTLAAANEYPESDLYAGASTEKERREISAAVDWLGTFLVRQESDEPLIPPIAPNEPTA